MSTLENLSGLVGRIPLIDVHTHVDLTHKTARGLHDVLLYHMVVSELYSAGCPDAERLPERPSDAEAERRILNALPYLPHVRHTSMHWILKKILRDLYGFEGEIDGSNWRAVDRTIREKYANDFSGGILDKAGIVAVNTEYCRKGGLEDPRFNYSLEWAFFTRAQYGIFDTPLVELEIASTQAEPEGPIPVNFDPARYEGRPLLRTVEQVDEAMDRYVAKIPFDRIVSLPTHFSTDIRYGEVTRERMARALADRATAGPAERDAYANYVNQRYFDALSRRGRKAVVSISVGAEPLRYETGTKLDADTLFAIEALAQKHPTLDFVVFNASDTQETALSGIIRQTRNVYAAAFWWHAFYPTTIERTIRTRLERIPLNKWFGYFSDAYCLDWAYGKSQLVRGCYARALSGLVDDGFLSLGDAGTVAERLLHGNAKDYFKL
jgi:glucuronate isomerase